MKKDVLVFTGSMARNLLKKGYTVVDIKPHRELENASVFIFKNDGNLMRDIRELRENG